MERLFYEQQYRSFIEGQNARNEKNRHPERNRTAEDLLKNRKTCPEETVFQIGTMEDHVSPEVLMQIVNEFMEKFDQRFGEHIHILDWALHMDESTPHIQERHVFDCENQYGETAPQQEKALEALGFELPDPEKPAGRKNNRKMVFDSACRAMLFDITKQYGLHLDEEPEYGGRAYLEKQDYILMKQKEKLAEQEEKITQADEKLETLTMKIEDVENLIDEVSDIAYNKAAEVVADAVCEETHEEDIRQIEERKNWLLSPGRKTPKNVREYAVEQLEGIISQIRKIMQKTADRIHERLMKPEVKQEAKAQIKAEARESVLKKLHDFAEREKKTDSIDTEYRNEPAKKNKEKDILL